MSLLSYEKRMSQPGFWNRTTQQKKIVRAYLRLSSFFTRFSEVEKTLLPNRICLYLFELSQKFNQFYEECAILNADEPLKTSRLILADLTARTIKLGLSLLGIEVLEKM